MATRWVILELRGAPTLLTAEVEASVDRSTLTEWLPVKRLMSFAEVMPQHVKERSLKPVKDPLGNPVKTYGPTTMIPEMLGIFGDDRAIRVSEILRWMDASDYWSEACDKAWEVDSRVWKSATSPLITSNSDALARMRNNQSNGELPKLPPLRLPE